MSWSLKLLCVLLFAASSILRAMDSVNWFSKLPEPICKEILYQLPFLTFLKSRSVCKDWRNKIDEKYNQDLTSQTVIFNEHFTKCNYDKIANKTNEFVAIYYLNYGYNIVGDEVKKYRKMRLSQICAAEKNLYVWLHNYLKQNKVVFDQKSQVIERRFCADLTSALWYAAESNSVNCTDLLLAFGTDADKSNPLSKAISGDHTLIAIKLIKAGAALSYKKPAHDLPGDTFDALKQAKARNNEELIEFITKWEKSPSELEEHKPKKQKLNPKIETLEFNKL